MKSRNWSWRVGVAAGVALLAATAACAPAPASAPAAAALPASPVTPVLTVQELMEHIVDPQADFVFDAVGVDVGPKGVVETKPTTDEDWTRIERGAYVLAESTNLLKIERAIAPPGAQNNQPGGPELTPDQIQAKVNENRALWNSHADTLRAEALKVVAIVKARDTDKLLAAGSAVDAACESCHLDFWYPGDREAVKKDRESRAYVLPPAEGKK
jgi:hypothetical protein